MIKKVFYVVKSELHYFPPCVSQIRMLNDLGVNVTVVYGSSDSKVIDIFKMMCYTERAVDKHPKIW